MVCAQEMEKVAQETMNKAVTYQNELENQKLSGQKQVGAVEIALYVSSTVVPVARLERCLAIVGARAPSQDMVVPAAREVVR